LQAQPLNWNSVQEVRDRFILVSRMIQLTRSIDLQRCWRTLASGQTGSVFIKIQRKGHKRPAWEALVRVPASPTLSPLDLALHYVALTASFAAPGSFLLRSLKPPFTPLSANSIGRITKLMLDKLGVPKEFWGPHSTRGAGVKYLKELGFSAEEVCELGKWKNPTAFTAHYLRLGAPRKVGHAVGAALRGRTVGPNQVHTDSPIRSAEPTRSRTPGTKRDRGGSDREGGAQGMGESCFCLRCLFVVLVG
jgi:hypothetical protein